jgi:hemerythrin-like domain-containing protein
MGVGIEEITQMDQHAAKPAPEMPVENRKSLAWWREAHRLQLALCNDLEAIADSLPRQVVAQDCIFAAKSLGRLIRDVHAYEERTLFPALNDLYQASPEISSAIERLTFEHLADECYADDLAEKLLQLANGSQNINMEALGYMLRGFFDALRRHIAFERDHFSGALDAIQTAAEWRAPPEPR